MLPDVGIEALAGLKLSGAGFDFLHDVSDPGFGISCAVAAASQNQGIFVGTLRKQKPHPLFTEQVVWILSTLGSTRASDKARRVKIAGLRSFGMVDGWDRRFVLLTAVAVQRRKMKLRVLFESGCCLLRLPLFLYRWLRPHIPSKVVNLSTPKTLCSNHAAKHHTQLTCQLSDMNFIS